jgi:hypothetical protein
MILYMRNDGISHPHVTLETRSSVSCATLSFNFCMSQTDIRGAIGTAAEMLVNAHSSNIGSVMLYYQTDTLLVYTPEWLPSCVTHHAPFADNFLRHFSPELAAQAYGSHEDAQHLLKQQRIGLDHLRQSKNTFVLQHSSLQGNYLLQHNVEPSRIRSLSPPISVRNAKSDQFSASYPETTAFICAGPTLLLFTAVARLDFFKNVELLADAGVELLSHGFEVKVLIAGGDESDSLRRAKLLNSVPVEFTPYFKAIPALSRDDLHALFSLVGDNGIFVCPSRYETLGMTPLEAALSGVSTVITDSPNVEASRYFPQENRFKSSVADLSSLVRQLQRQGMGARGNDLRCKIRGQISDESFRASLLDAWQGFSEIINENIGSKR